MQNVRIYQLYFRPEHRGFLNPLFTPYDNTANKAPNMREYPLLKECYKLAVADGLTHWGGVSWNYKFKFNDRVDADNEIFLRHIAKNPGYDTYFFNPFTNHAAAVWNVWEQGQWCHPHIVTIMEHLLPLMGESVEILTMPQTNGSIFWGSMCIGNKQFWDRYIDFADRYVSSIDKLPPYVKHLHNSSAAYVDGGINYFSFIQERLMSSWLATSGLKIMPWHAAHENVEPVVEELNNLKVSGDWNQWLHIRKQYIDMIYPGYKIDWGSRWHKLIS